MACANRSAPDQIPPGRKDAGLRRRYWLPQPYVRRTKEGPERSVAQPVRHPPIVCASQKACPVQYPCPAVRSSLLAILRLRIEVAGPPIRSRQQCVLAIQPKG